MTSGAPLDGRSFHDAEVTTLRLDRAGPSLVLDVTTAATPPEHLRLRFGGVEDLEAAGFNGQNVLFDLQAKKVDDEHWSVDLSASFGLSARFRCRTISLDQRLVGEPG